MAGFAEPEDPLLRLSRAVDAFLQHSDQNGEGREAFLDRHEELRDLLEPMFAEGERGTEQAASERYLGDFRLVREIGRGGMGVVYEAWQVSLGRRVAVKVLPAHLTLSPVQIERFRREATAAARLQHPGIVPIYFVGEAGGAHFFAMEYVAGCSLQERLAQIERGDAASLGVLDGLSRAAEAAEVVAQAAQALHYAHQNGVIHRDVKPHNILIGSDGVVRLVDFGLAKDLGRDSLSHTGDFAGTPQYVSPEQALGHRDRVDHRSDVFSLGIVLYELLAGSAPFDAETTHGTLAAVTSLAPRSLRKRGASVPLDLEVICYKALEKRPDDRYQSARELQDDLRRFLRYEPIHATRPSVLSRAIKFARRRRAWTAALASVLLLAALVAAFGIHGARQEEQARRNLAQARAALDQLADVVDDVGLRYQTEKLDSYRRTVQEMVGQYEALLARSDDAELRAEAWRAYVRATDLYFLLDRLDEARAVATRAVALARGLVADVAEDPEHRYRLASALFNRSRSMRGAELAGRRAADLAESIVLYGELEQLEGPSDLPERARRWLATAYTGQVMDLDGWATGGSPPPGAREKLERALELWARVPGPTEEHELRTRCELAYAYSGRGDVVKAIEILTEVIGVGETRFAADSGDKPMLELLGVAHARLAECCYHNGDSGRAIEAYRRAIECQATLVSKQSRPVARAELAQARLRLSQALRTVGEEVEAEELFGLARSELSEIQENHPDERIAGFLAELRTDEASRALKRGAPREELEPMLLRAIELKRLVAKSSPGQVAHRRSLGGLFSNLASRELAWGEVDSAYHHALEAVTWQQQALRGDPSHALSRKWLGIHHRVVLAAASRLPGHAELAAAAEAYAAYSPDDAQVQMEAATHLCECSMRAAAEETVAESYGERAVALLRSMLDKGMTRRSSLDRSRALDPLRELESFRAMVGER